MAFVKQFKDFKLFQPTEEEASAALASLPSRLEINRSFLERHQEMPLATMKITGSFISAHAPDYVGVPTLHWGVDHWRREFRVMKEAGLDTVILQAAAWKELEECYYPSDVLKSFEAFDVLSPLAEAASLEKMLLFMGGLGSVSGWDLQNEEKTRREIELHTSVLSELAQRYGNGIAGFYFPCETAFRGERRPEHELQYGKILGDFCRTARELLPGKAIVMSPSSKYFEGKSADFLACWERIFSFGTPDILAPQDSIGCGGCNLANQASMWKLWKELATEVGCRLWANIELFERRTFGGEDPFDAATPERVQCQLANVAPYVEKCVCWEFSTFVNGQANGADALRKVFSR